MLKAASISKHLRVIFTALTLLCVMALNHREVQTYAAAPETPASQQLNKSAAERHGVVKQKVSLEATQAYVLVQLAAATEFFRLSFPTPVLTGDRPAPLVRVGVNFFRVLFASTIQPNAP